jgi:hypothetical protein
VDNSHRQVAVLVLTTHELIDLAGKRLLDAAGSPAQVILFGSAACGELSRRSRRPTAGSCPISATRFLPW